MSQTTHEVANHTSRLRLLIFGWRDIKNPSAGGAEKYIHEISRRLVQRGHTVTLLTTSYAGCKKEEKIDGVTVIRRGNKISVYVIAFFFYVLHWKKDFDCVLESKDGGIPWLTYLYRTKAFDSANTSNRSRF